MAKNKNNKPATDEENPGVETEENVEENETDEPEAPAKNESGAFKFRYTEKTSFKTDVIIDGEKHVMNCKDGIISTSSPALAHHLRGKYPEVR